VLLDSRAGRSEISYLGISKPVLFAVLEAVGWFPVQDLKSSLLKPASIIREGE